MPCRPLRQPSWRYECAFWNLGRSNRHKHYLWFGYPASARQVCVSFSEELRSAIPERQMWKWKLVCCSYKFRLLDKDSRRWLESKRLRDAIQNHELLGTQNKGIAGRSAKWPREWHNCLQAYVKAGGRDCVRKKLRIQLFAASLLQAKWIEESMATNYSNNQRFWQKSSWRCWICRLEPGPRLRHEWFVSIPSQTPRKVWLCWTCPENWSTDDFTWY